MDVKAIISALENQAAGRERRNADEIQATIIRRPSGEPDLVVLEVAEQAILADIVNHLGRDVVTVDHLGRDLNPEHLGRDANQLK